MIYFTAYYSKGKPIGVSQPRVSLRFRKSPGTSWCRREEAAAEVQLQVIPVGA
jgi:hypothetical protein